MTQPRSFKQQPESHRESGDETESLQSVRRLLATVRKAYDDAVYLNGKLFKSKF